MNQRRVLYAFLTVLALFLVGAVVVLSSVSYYLAIDPKAYLTEREIPWTANSTHSSPPSPDRPERIQRIIHQTWKTDELPSRWRGISQACRDMMPDYEYKLWTDAGSRDFIAEHYSWFLDTFDNYVYPIQRADAIRYFVLYHYGGIYVDLDIGCLRPMDPLLSYPVILPKTIPVGVSNDLMFAEKGHPFLKQTIDNIMSFDYSWVLNYPTVMFSTGPMFLSAQYGIYVANHKDTALTDIRILPKSLYGKNAKDHEAPHSFFSHFYGSSWHADDAAFIAFLSTWGKGLMWVGLLILIFGLYRLARKPRRSLRRIGGYEILLPSLSRSGRVRPSLSLSSYSLFQAPPSDGSSSPSEDEEPLLRLPLAVDPSREPLDSDPYAGNTSSPIVDAFRRVRNRVSAMTGTAEPIPETPDTPIRPRRRNVLFFLPAVFTTAPAPNIELQAVPQPRSAPRTLSASSLPRHTYSSEKQYRYGGDIETGPMSRSRSPSQIDGEETPFELGEGSHSRESSWETAVEHEGHKDT